MKNLSLSIISIMVISRNATDLEVALQVLSIREQKLLHYSKNPLFKGQQHENHLVLLSLDVINQKDVVRNMIFKIQSSLYA